MSNIKYADLTGEVFGKLTILSRERKENIQGVCYKVRCECGTEKIVRASNLMAGTAKSCGCYHRKLIQDYVERSKGKGNKSQSLIKIITPEMKQQIESCAEQGKTITATARVIGVSYKKLETYLKKQDVLLETFRKNSHTGRA